MPNNGYFSIKGDFTIIKAGGFFCNACLAGKPVAEQSPDPHYCQRCYHFLIAEAELLSPGKRPAWIPKKQKPKKAVEQQYQVSQVGYRNMSTLTNKKSEVDIINPPVTSRAIGKRGPKQKNLPVELISQWAGEGMGSKAVATRLRSELDITVSYKTIQRILSGQRVLANV